MDSFLTANLIAAAVILIVVFALAFAWLFGGRNRRGYKNGAHLSRLVEYMLSN